MKHTNRRIPFQPFTGSVRGSVRFSQMLIAMLTVSLLTVLFAGLYNQMLLSNTIRDSDVKTRLIERNLALLTENAENYSRILSFDNSMQQQLAMLDFDSDTYPVQLLSAQRVFRDVSANITAPNTNIFGTAVLSNGTLLTGGYGDTTALEDLFTQEMCDHIVASQKPVWVGPIRLPYYEIKSMDLFVIAKSVISKNLGNSLGIVALYLPESEICSSFSNTSETYLIVNAAGTVISSENKDDLYRPVSDLHPVLSAGMLPVLAQKGHDVLQLNSGRSLVTVQRLAPLGWYIVSFVPMQSLRMTALGIIAVIFSTVLLTMIPVYLFINRFLHRQITLPVQSFVDTMERIEAGELDSRIHGLPRNEFGRIADSFNNLMDNIQHLMEDIKEKEKSRQATRMKLLQSQINPHFLYNTIETIIACIRLGLTDKAIAVAQSLARFYRVSLSNGTDIITLEQEFTLTNYYLSILNIRHVEYLDYRIHLDESIKNVRIPKLTLQPIVENAINHGLKSKGERGFISVTGRRQGAWVYLEVLDNGVGIPPEKITKLLRGVDAERSGAAGYGISNVVGRLTLLYGQNFELDIDSVPNSYTKFVLKIKLEGEPC